jgi:glycosyltransferase involved in cell wall biosynthesis
MKYLKRRLNFLFVKTASFYREFIVIRLPSSMMEAMAMEKPVVAYNNRGVRDLVKDGVNGFLVPFGDVKALTEKIIYLMDNQSLQKKWEKGEG